MKHEAENWLGAEFWGPVGPLDLGKNPGEIFIGVALWEQKTPSGWGGFGHPGLNGGYTPEPFFWGRFFSKGVLLNCERDTKGGPPPFWAVVEGQKWAHIFGFFGGLAPIKGLNFLGEMGALRGPKAGSRCSRGKIGPVGGRFFWWSLTTERGGANTFSGCSNL